METNVINVAAFAESAEVRDALVMYANVRSITLNRLCAMPGYKDMTRTERNAMYDTIKAEVMEGVRA